MRSKEINGEKGVTIIEILLAVAISAIGFAAVFAMQISSVQGNIGAREVAAAVNLAESTIELLQRESYKWVEASPPEPYLNRQADEWYTLTPTPVDHNGRVSKSIDAQMGSLYFKQRFCVHYRLEPKGGVYGGLLAGRVRVVWPYATFSERDFSEACAQDELEAYEPKIGDWYSLTLPFVLRAGGGT